jgi:hypothetical protein
VWSRKTITRFVTAVSAVGVGLVAVGVISACGMQKADEPFQDAPRGQTNSQPANVIEMPDGFSNVAHKCVGTGKLRVFVLFKGDHPYGSIAVEEDPACP